MDNTSSLDEEIQKKAAILNKEVEVIRSYYRVRQALGYLGLFFPLALIVSGVATQAGIEPSVSDFFHTLSRDIFVGVMCTIGVFLFTYQGYDRQPGESFTDNWLSTIAGVAAFGVALFPNESPTGTAATVSQLAVGVKISPMIHYASCTVFFYCLGHFCFFKFAKTTNPRRRKVYVYCGWVILFSGIMIGVLSVLKHSPNEIISTAVIRHNLVFWVEAIGVWAFALSWLAKGKADISLSRITSGSQPVKGEAS